MTARLKTLAPLLVAVLLVVATLVFHAVDTPSTGDDGYLSPTGTDRFSGHELERLLTADGRRVVRHTVPADALNDAIAGNTTLFLPAPEYLNRDFFRQLTFLPATTRIVLVQPGQAALDDLAAESLRGTPRVLGERWATAVVGPGGCDIGGAGDAAVGRVRYRLDGAQSCYDGHVLLSDNFVIVGAADPFSDERIGEHDNARLAVALLGRYPNIAWLDQHSLVVPSPSPTPTLPHVPEVCGTPAAPGVVCVTLPPESPRPTARCTVPSPTSTPQPTYTCYIAGHGGGGTGGGGGGGGGGGSERQPNPNPDEGSEKPPNPLWAAFPPWFWAALVGLAIAALLLVLARARRLGQPVAERLPVVVRSTETITGRGRLYARAHARLPALDAVRAGARRRLVAALALGPTAMSGEIVAAVAARTGRTEDAVQELLYGVIPETDAELTSMADAIDRLVEDTTRETRSD
ncbi:hypothetical protein Lfu02_15950 [Longispora fulva]|uniref:DUF4350 domain-containing protein n=1 Tax=Longispora fulva TaxID=619741 RepID=A0A8J7GLF9_9ACTN|nr:DUF4350 domain-containing protein [Longispora fulva]MBG6140396.1 hypothetical protein [Longispora fulva]GIG57223.1 hypothetical protein Lfu02_15950 [Longispora fulva]